MLDEFNFSNFNIYAFLFGLFLVPVGIIGYMFNFSIPIFCAIIIVLIFYSKSKIDRYVAIKTLNMLNFGEKNNQPLLETYNEHIEKLNNIKQVISNIKTVFKNSNNTDIVQTCDIVDGNID